jgi:hypothetical protein
MAFRSIITFTLPVLLFSLGITIIILFITTIPSINDNQDAINNAKKLIPTLSAQANDAIAAAALELTSIIGSMLICVNKTFPIKFEDAF